VFDSDQIDFECYSKKKATGVGIFRREGFQNGPKGRGTVLDRLGLSVEYRRI